MAAISNNYSCLLQSCCYDTSRLKPITGRNDETCASPFLAAGTGDSWPNRSSTAEKLANLVISGFALNSRETTEEAAAPRE